MARIGENAFRQYRDGQDRLTAPEYMAERELIRLAVNDLDDKIQRTESIREEFTNTVNEVEVVKQDVETRIGDFTQTIGQVSETVGNVEGVVNSIASQVTDISYKRINVRNYGAKGDGVTDDSQSIINAIKEIPKDGGILEFPTGVYLHGDGVTTAESYRGYTSPSGTWAPDPTQDANLGRDIRFLFEGYKNLTIIGNNSTIMSNELNGETRNNSIFSFIECDNLKVYDLVVDGNIEVREPEFNDRDDGKGHLVRGNIYLQNCRDVYFKNVQSHYSMLDGIFAYKTRNGISHNHIYEDCICKYNYRQGLTLSSISNAKVIRGEYSYSGTIFGIMPKSGIDIEADASNAKDIDIIETVCRGNASNNLILSFRSTGIVVNACRFYDGSVLMESPLNRGNVIKNCKFYNNSLTVMQEEVKVINNEFVYDRLRTYFEIDWNNIPDNGGSFSEFSGNKIICKLPENIDMAQTLYCGATRVSNNKTKIIGNEFINLFATKYATPLYYALTLLGHEIKDNVISYTGSHDVNNTKLNVFSDRMVNNPIKGYAQTEVVRTVFLTGHKLLKHFELPAVATTPITFEMKSSSYFKVTIYESTNSHFEEKVYVWNSAAGNILGSSSIVINPSNNRKFEINAVYDFTNKVATCSIVPSFTGTLYIDIETTSRTFNLNENSIQKR